MMQILNADNINNLRMAVMKFVFQYVYSHDFSFTLNESVFADNNYLDAIEINSYEYCYVFLESMPNLNFKNKDNRKVIVYYVDKTYKSRKERDYVLEERKLSEEYVTLLNAQFNNGFKNIDTGGLFINRYIKGSCKNKIFYKYYSKKQDIDIFSKIQNGMVSFTKPSRFNDPFDCDYINPFNSLDKNYFKVLCLSKQYDNILLWSYYASDHEGYCLGYDAGDILDKVSEIYNGLCVIGKVKYANKRPNYKINKRTTYFDTIVAFINSTFTKFNDWSHEEEYRMLIIDENKNIDYKTVNVDIKEAYTGINSDINLKVPYIKLNKNMKDYKVEK